MAFRNGFLLGAASIVILSLAACRAEKVVDPTDAKPASASAQHTHEAWWCDEHGVPEEECAQCNGKLVAAFKAKGDWCEKHNRPESQCFICHPEKEAEFAALYEAKFGKKPPKIEADNAEEKLKS